jgi:sugar O-acyltransferase (sialic acid O-acetyltransferase NeuD family)
MKIGFIGFGELGTQIQLFVQQHNSNVEIYYFDDSLTDIVNLYKFEDYKKEALLIDKKIVIALGYKHLQLKKNLFDYLIEKSTDLFTFKHPTCFINQTAIIKDGVILYPFCNIDKEVIIETGVIVNNSVTISHNSTIQTCSYISPGVIISGNVIIGECCFIGASVVIANNITIGNNVVIGIGTVVTKNIPDNSFVIGNPMRFVNNLVIH